jgi:hypothetical protein
MTILDRPIAEKASLSRDEWFSDNGRRQAVRRGVQLGLWLTGLYLLATSIHGYGAFGVDTHAYWMTAHSAHLYDAPPGGVDAYLYSPAFAQLIRPLALLPFHLFALIVLALDLAAFLWLLAPLGWAWRAPLLLMCTPDLVAGQVTGIITMAVVIAALGRPGWWAVGWLTKIVPGVLGAVWCATRRDWRGVAVAAAWTGGISLVSFVVWPSAWVEWVTFLLAAPSTPMTGVREVAAVVLIVVGVVRKWWWALPVALVLGAPVLAGYYIFTQLAALARLSPKAQRDLGMPRSRTSWLIRWPGIRPSTGHGR